MLGEKQSESSPLVVEDSLNPYSQDFGGYQPYPTKNSSPKKQSSLQKRSRSDSEIGCNDKSGAQKTNEYYRIQNSYFTKLGMYGTPTKLKPVARSRINSGPVSPSLPLDIPKSPQRKF